MRDGVLYHKAFMTSYSFADFLPDSWLLLADSFRAAMRALDLPQFAAAFAGTSPVTMSRARPPPGTLVGLRSNVLGVRGGGGTRDPTINSAGATTPTTPYLSRIMLVQMLASIERSCSLSRASR